MIAENLCMGCMKEIGSKKQCPHCGFNADSPQLTPYLPLRTVIAERYVVGKLMTAGGDGVTYMGYDLQNSVPVTIREFLPEKHIKRLYDTTEVTVKKGSELAFHDGIAAFLDLWRKLARGRDLQGLLPVLDIIEENGTAYSISEYIDTITLRDFLLKSRTGTLPWERLKSILFPLFTTIDTLHSMGVYHLGISPNTLVLGRDGKLRITGFMINEARCQNTDFDCELYAGYAAIEQYSYLEDCGPWSDIYAIAGVIYRSLVGSTPAEASERITNDKLMLPPRLIESLPAYLITALDHAINIEPADRTESIELLREELSGSPSTMATSRKTNEAPTTTEDELAERKRLEKLAIQEQNKQRQIKMSIITFLIVIAVGLLGVGGYFAVQHFTAPPEETTTQPAASEIIEVPNFVGMVYTRIASDEIQKTRFKMVAEYAYSDEYETGYIIAQSLEPNTQVEKGAQLVFTVSKGKEQVVLPDVVGSTYETAEKILTEAGFKCTKVEKNNDGTHTVGEVVALTPEAGGTYEKGKEIYVQVWGPAPTTTQPETTTKSLVDTVVDLIGG